MMMMMSLKIVDVSSEIWVLLHENGEFQAPFVLDAVSGVLPVQQQQGSIQGPLLVLASEQVAVGLIEVEQQGLFQEPLALQVLEALVEVDGVQQVARRLQMAFQGPLQVLPASLGVLVEA